MTKLTEADIHGRVEEVIRQTGKITAKEFYESGAVVRGTAARQIYAKIRDKRIYGKSFYGHGDWYTYLEKQHGIQTPRTTLPPQARIWTKRTPEELHELVSRIIQQTGKTATRHWEKSRELFEDQSLKSIYAAVAGHKLAGKSFFGHGAWEAYLENEHGVVPLNSVHWSDERLHQTIAKLVRKYPPNSVNWEQDEKKEFHGKSLSNLYDRAYLSNKKYRKNFQRFFGHETWKKYLDWLEQNYPKEHSEKAWREAIEAEKK